jgi:hypothetical protein
METPPEATRPFAPWAIARVALAAGAVWLLGGPLPAPALAAGLLALVVAGFPVFREAATNLFAGRMTMELSMAIALLAAAAIAEIFTTFVITFFVLLAEELEHLTIARGRVAIRELVDFLPAKARAVRGGGHAARDPRRHRAGREARLDREGRHPSEVVEKARQHRLAPARTHQDHNVTMEHARSPPADHSNRLANPQDPRLNGARACPAARAR